MVSTARKQVSSIARTRFMYTPFEIITRRQTNTTAFKHNFSNSVCRCYQTAGRKLLLDNLGRCLKLFVSNYYVAYAFVVCVKINNEELVLNAFPFENSYYVSLDRLRCSA